MLTMNRATLLGHAGRNPEIRKLPSGDDVALFSLATTERFRRRDGTDAEATEWHAVAAYGAAAVAARKLLRKGDRVLVEGRIATRFWRDRTGTERRITEIVVSGPRGHVNVLTKRARESDGSGGDDEPPGGAAPAGAAKVAEAEPADGVAAGSGTAGRDAGREDGAAPAVAADATEESTGETGDPPVAGSQAALPLPPAESAGGEGSAGPGQERDAAGHGAGMDGRAAPGAETAGNGCRSGSGGHGHV